MPPRVSTLCCFAALNLALLAAARAEVPLASKSPFLPPAAAGAAAPTAGAPLEFRGVMETAQGLKVRIVDPARRAGAWLLLNERDPSFDFVVKQYDAEHDTATVDYQGRPITLAQHVAKVASAGAPQNFIPPGQAGGMPPMPPAITNSVVLNPTPADEQKRLDAVATEVARRRALREQAAQSVGQGVPLAPQVIQQQQEFRQQQQQQPQQVPQPRLPAPNSGSQRDQSRSQRPQRNE